jgi:hypothetical protein
MSRSLSSGAHWRDPLAHAGHAGSNAGVDPLIGIPAIYSIVAINIKQFIVVVSQVANGDTPAATINSQSAKALIFLEVQSRMARVRYNCVRAISTRS